MNRLIAFLGVTVVLGACTFHRGEGEACDDESPCKPELRCMEGRCAIDPERRKDMAAQSGVALQAEGRPEEAEGQPGAVRIRSASGVSLVFAMCAANERLLGGWCEPPGIGGDNASLVVQSAADYTEHDTIGAMWKCRYRGGRRRGLELQAFAFCQQIEAPAADVASP